MSHPHPPTKTCATCGREMTWRKKWARTWPEVKHCSDACRRGNSQASRDTGQRLESAIRQLLAERPQGATICPSEAARAVAPNDWRPLMNATRAAGERLSAAGEVVFTQGGRVVDPSKTTGPLRLRRAH